MDRAQVTGIDNVDCLGDLAERGKMMKGKIVMSHKLSRRRFHFRFVYLSVLIVLIAFSTNWLRPFWFDWPGWQPFTWNVFQDSRQQGKLVIVYFRDDWSLTFDAIQKDVLDSSRIERELRRLAVVPLVAHRTLSNSDLERELTLVAGSPNLPAVVVYPAGQSSRPVIVQLPLDQNSVLKAIAIAGSI
ncbi:MAG: hypothetical protein ACI87E_004230 [Mariniblastus sp.]